MDETERDGTYAAVDLGSNSFHLVVARWAGGRMTAVDHVRDGVQLASGLTADRQLDPVVAGAALASLTRFGQRLRDVPPEAVRAVGTNTLRQLRDEGAFLTAATEALGHPIEVVSGREEARLVYLGVATDLGEDDGRRRLVVDIGGGSTECIIGERLTPIARDSLYMGCVSHTRRFFPDGAVTRERFEEALMVARLELQPIERSYRALGWERCVGASGTIRSIDRVVREAGWSSGGITREALKKLRKALLGARRPDRLSLPGLSPDRAAVLPGGLAVLTAVFMELEVDHMTASEGALREGLLHDLMGRRAHEDAREATVESMTGRYAVDRAHAAAVEATALALHAQVATPWNLRDEEGRLLLMWAARLHEVGLGVSYTGHHRHGAYLVAHSDMPGFSRDEQRALASLLRFQRRRIVPTEITGSPLVPATEVLRLTALLRLAVLLHRARSPRPLPEIGLAAEGDALELSLDTAWLADHPLTGADLHAEQRHLGKVGIALRLRDVGRGVRGRSNLSG